MATEHFEFCQRNALELKSVYGCCVQSLRIVGIKWEQVNRYGGRKASEFRAQQENSNMKYSRIFSESSASEERGHDNIHGNRARKISYYANTNLNPEITLNEANNPS